jgi:hypothetical protein
MMLFQGSLSANLMRKGSIRAQKEAIFRGFLFTTKITGPFLACFVYCLLHTSYLHIRPDFVAPCGPFWGEGGGGLGGVQTGHISDCSFPHFDCATSVGYFLQIDLEGWVSGWVHLFCGQVKGHPARSVSGLAVVYPLIRANSNRWRKGRISGPVRILYPAC